MKNILSSASKIVFLLITVTACVALFVNKINAEQFMILAGSAFSFYFASKQTDSNGQYTK